MTLQTLIYESLDEFQTPSLSFYERRKLFPPFLRCIMRNDYFSSWGEIAGYVQ